VNHCSKYPVEVLNDNSNSYNKDSAAYDITVNIISTKGKEGTRIEYKAGVSKDHKSSLIKSGTTSHGFSGTSASILLTFANPGFPGCIASINPTVKISVKSIKIIGLMAMISYMIVILFTWIYANMEGHVYFSAGEPVLSIKYPEWVLGFLGIFVAADYLRKELNEDMIY